MAFLCNVNAKMARSMSTLKFEILANANVAKLLTGKFADDFMLVDYVILSCLTSSYQLSQALI